MSFAGSAYPTRVISHKRLNFRPLVTWVPPLAVTTVQWLTTSNKVTLFQAVLAGILLWMPWYVYCRWQDHGRAIFPLFSMVAAAHWMTFGSLLFWGGQPSDPIYSVPFSEETLSAIVGMACLGVLSLRLGMKMPLRFARLSRFPDLVPGERSMNYLHLVMAFCTLMVLASEDFVASLGSLKAVAEIFRGVIPHTIFVILMYKYLTGEANRRDRIVLFSFAAVRVVQGVAGGWLGSTISLGIVGCIVFVRIYRRLPRKALLTIVPLLLFLQAGKQAFRQVYWIEQKSGSTTEKVLFWVNESFDVWSKALSGNGNQRDSATLVTQTFKRVSLLDQAGNVYDKTPGQVPYQLGKSYTFLLITLIPRAIWPEKPTVNDANRFYQVAYGMSTEEELDGVSISVGFLVESYMNFGWPGVVFVMFGIGLFLGIYERTLLSEESGLILNSIGMAILYYFLSVEAQAAQYLGAMGQHIGMTLLVLSPIMRFRNAPEREALV
ncbi:MAG: O-antigen polysaccharide polymerase Wzy [Acidobacteriia bacterium]|nr:O-antigen polysaccharide polymerase Wzy [Terriglobia bacterium]